ncbi:MAG: PIN domain-containing protein [Chloroflexi bacterium]|nr:PIN domain-containing protein [Chloroflexota bacterium]
MVYVLDTHVLIWFLEGNKRLSAAAKTILTDTAAQLVIPTLVLAEAAYLYARKRTSVDIDRILTEIASAENCTVYPLDERVAAHVSGNLDLHDAIIVGTAIVYRDVLGKEVAIVTRDEMIARSGLVPVVW